MSRDRTSRPFADLTVDHVEMYVSDVESKAATLSHRYGLRPVGVDRVPGTAVSYALASTDILFVLTEPLMDDHPGTAYLGLHGDGVANIGMGTADARAAFAEAVGRGAVPVTEPVERDGFVSASVMGFGDVVHTFLQRPPRAARHALPGFASSADLGATEDVGLRQVDHFAICVEGGRLDPVVDFYGEVFDFSLIFEERIVVGAQAMNSKVVQSASGLVTFTVIEPDLSRESGQIDEFLKNHGGSGVQHVAMTTEDIVASVAELGRRDVAFLSTPGTYYDLLTRRIQTARHTVDELRRLNVLVDEDHDGQLFQIFARSTHPRSTYFFEVIERAGAKTFGSGNIKALYEAVELYRAQEERRP
ncbi:4-hydroxyphenylpyruvate dioxygenase [Streptomyces sp. SBT349]|uniref:4-hydroxyphenylpyruvate dioxygenase n=1 Tax=Streptomyces sp. SBT349 TaxID=1580539 RepID=UPI000AF1ABDB|nr:4-hydroxyphenylpyruvate dioxygenase [Streptomyces sp. SBT349]